MNRNAMRIGALGTTIVAVGATGIAFAAWTATGNGAGAAKGYTMTVSALTPSDPSANLLYPGQNAGDLNVSLKNNNPFAVHVDSIVQQVSGSPATPVAITSTGGKGTCTNNAVTYTAPLAAAINTAIGNAGVLNANETVSFTLPGVVAMGSSDDGCQGASFSVPLTVTESQTAAHS